MLISFLYKHYGISNFISLGFCNVILSQKLRNLKKDMETLFTFALVYFLFRLLISVFRMSCRMEWCDEKIELLINFSSQYTYLFGEKLSDYHIRMKRAASRSFAIIHFDAINRRQFFRARCNRHEKLTPESGVEFLAPISGAGFCSVCMRL